INSATVNLKNSIVENNFGAPTNCAGVITSQGDNLSQGTSCGFNAALHDINNAANPDPLLGTLALNPPTPPVATPGNNLTVALLPGSLAIDGVQHNPCPPPGTDERGVPRPQGAACDIGAFEVQVSPTPTATATPTRTSTATSTATSTPPGATATATATSTATPTPPVATATAIPTLTPTITPTPFPRPNVQVLVTSSPVAEQLQATLVARDAGCSPNNQLQALRFQRLMNATVDVPGVGTITAP